MLGFMTLTCPTAHQLLAVRPMAQPTPLDFVVVGLNHQTAPVEVRERAAVRIGPQRLHLARGSGIAPLPRPPPPPATRARRRSRPRW